MGYNTQLSNDQNKTLYKIGKRHKLWVLGQVLRIVGLIIVIPSAIMIISAGGWGIYLLLNPIPLAGALMLAFGQYFVSNWKNKS